MLCNYGYQYQCRGKNRKHKNNDRKLCRCNIFIFLEFLLCKGRYPFSNPRIRFLKPSFNRYNFLQIVKHKYDQERQNPNINIQFFTSNSTLILIWGILLVGPSCPLAQVQSFTIPLFISTLISNVPLRYYSIIWPLQK